MKNTDIKRNMNINFLGGSGEMGRVHIPVLEAAGHKVHVTGRTSKLTPVEAAKTCDLTLIAVPIPVTREVIAAVAPYAPAIIDLTGLKTFPLEAMVEHAQPSAEIAGLHPSYGEVESIQGRTVFHCDIGRAGPACRAVISALKAGGARIKEITPKKHDLVVGGLAQFARVMCLEAYMKLLQRYDVDMDDFYEFCPPPTRIMLDLIARQAKPNKDLLYCSMREYNPYARQVGTKLQRCLRDVLRKGMSPKEIREMYGTKILEAAQKSASNIINREH